MAREDNVTPSFEDSDARQTEYTAASNMEGDTSPSLEAQFKGVKDIHLKLLSQLAATCRAFAQLRTLEKDNPHFLKLITYAGIVGELDDRVLADLAATTRETANRWANGKATPSPAAQRDILGRLGNYLEEKASTL